ncbi:Alpha/beta hydrolase family-domain-containing protein [Xylariales sp. AK1849]|nr:Alpha/beta hydrolase family-domain-containing protein [Xylariales sp. AK1849]
MRLNKFLTAAVLLTAGSAKVYEVPHTRTYFYVGGVYGDDGAGSLVFHNQMYVEQFSPLQHTRQESPIVMIHGQAQTGTNFLNKPDNGIGWASRFLERGHDVYLVDQTLRGRSAWQPGAGAVNPSTYSVDLIQQHFTAPERYLLWPQASLHTQWPGNGSMGDPIFDGFYSSNVQFINNATYQQLTVQAAGAALLDKIGRPVVLLGHSQGGLMPTLIADVRANLTKAIVLLEPTGPPFQDAVFSNTSARAWGLVDVPITYNPPIIDPIVELVRQAYPATDENHTICILQAENPAPRQLANLASLPILVLTTEASYHATYDYCTVEYLRQAGCGKTDHMELGNLGISGNGHMLFMEKNSDQIHRLVQEWIVKATPHQA